MLLAVVCFAAEVTRFYEGPARRRSPGGITISLARPGASGSDVDPEALRSAVRTGLPSFMMTARFAPFVVPATEDLARLQP